MDREIDYGRDKADYPFENCIDFIKVGLCIAGINFKICSNSACPLYPECFMESNQELGLDKLELVSRLILTSKVKNGNTRFAIVDYLNALENVRAN
jgi:hypothetical protein